MNNRYKLRVEDPLLRPGLSIETEVSERYVVRGTLKLMEHAREINKAEEALVSEKTKPTELKVVARTPKIFRHVHLDSADGCNPECGWYELGRQITSYDVEKKTQVDVPVKTTVT